MDGVEVVPSLSDVDAAYLRALRRLNRCGVAHLWRYPTSLLCGRTFYS
jgi:hypothetical protein